MTDVLKPKPQVSTLRGEVSLLDPRPEDIHLDVIETGLRHQSRFAGQTLERLSLLQHSYHVWLLAYTDGADSATQLAALTHDFPEAYLLDVPTPLKRLLGETYREIEHRFDAAVSARFGVQPRAVKDYDQQALSLECTLYRPIAAYQSWTGLVDVAHLPIATLAGCAKVFAAGQRLHDVVDALQRDATKVVESLVCLHGGVPLIRQREEVVA